MELYKYDLKYISPVIFNPLIAITPLIAIFKAIPKRKLTLYKSNNNNSNM